MSAHTPGPWKWWTSNGLRRLSYGNKDGAVLSAVRLRDGFADIEVSEEDARLIELAPEMLESLIELRDLCDLLVGFGMPIGQGHEGSPKAKADALIAKATGSEK